MTPESNKELGIVTASLTLTLPSREAQRCGATGQEITSNTACTCDAHDVIMAMKRKNIAKLLSWEGWHLYVYEEELLSVGGFSSALKGLKTGNICIQY